MAKIVTGSTGKKILLFSTTLKWATIITLYLALEATAQKPMKRKDLLQVNLNERPVSAVKIVEIEFPGGQPAPYHQHPCPVIGYITAGTCLLQVEGEPAQILKAGSVFYEPAGKPILHFDNYSKTEPLRFIAHYLVNGEQDLVQLLPPKK